MPGKTPSLSSRKSRSPSPKGKHQTPQASPTSGRKKSASGASASPSGKKSPARTKSSSPKRRSAGSTRSGSSKAKSPSSGTRSKTPKDESAFDSFTVTSAKKKNVVIKTPELTERGLKVLDFSGQGMTSVPPSLLSTKDVGVLILASNNLRSLPPEIRKMKSLIKLDISRNGIRCTHPGDYLGLPQEMESLTDLEELKICECNLPYVPPAIWRLRQLKVLDMNRNKINILPPEIGNLTELRRLNLQQTSITSLPPEIAYCQELEEILLWGNSIETLPDTLPEMPKLRVLALNYRSFCGVVDPYMENLLRKRQINSEHVPVVVFELPALEVLDLESTKLNNLPEVCNINLKEFYLCRNFLQSIPPSIYNLKYLQVLDMSFNLLVTLPEDIGRMRSLKVLRLNNNSFERVPPTIGLLQNLTELNMASNRIRRLPSEIQGLTNLKTLILENNDLQSLPDEICELTTLETLDLTGNSIKALPMKLYKLANLKQAHGFQKFAKYGLWLYRNPLEQPPPEVWRTEKPENIYNYLKKLHIIQTENLQRQKILMLGNSQAGKTSLVHVISQGKSTLTRAMVDRTRLLEQTTCKTENNVSFMLLDFGSDPAYELMHGMFLDRKALAMIVYNANTFCEEVFQDVIGRWLDMLNYHTPGVVVKLVGTQCDLLAHDIEKEVPRHQDIVSQLVKRHLDDYHNHLRAELESVQADLLKLDKSSENQHDLNILQETTLKMLQTRQERLKNILDCPLQVVPNVSSVSSTQSLEGIREMVSELEHLTINQALFPYAQRKIPEHWNRLRAKIKLQKGCYLLWDNVVRIADMFGMQDNELNDCIHYLCDTGEVLWYEHFSGLSEILFHHPRVLVDLLAALYRHDIHEFLQYPENKIFFSKGHLTADSFEETRDLFVRYGQITRPLLNCLWFHQKVSEDFLTDLLELLPLLDLCYTIPESDVLTIHLHQRPLMVLPYYNQDMDVSHLEQVWPEPPPSNEKTLKVVYNFPIVFPKGVFEQVCATIHDMVITRMDWRDIVFATTEEEKILIRKFSDPNNRTGSLAMYVRGSDVSQVQEMMKELMEQVTELLKRYPGSYWNVDILGGSTDTLLKFI